MRGSIVEDANGALKRAKELQVKWEAPDPRAVAVMDYGCIRNTPITVGPSAWFTVVGDRGGGADMPISGHKEK